MAKPGIPFNTLLKSALLVSLTPLMVLAILVVNEQLELFYFLLAYAAILIGSLFFVYPFLANVSALTEYVQALSQDKRAKPPDLSFLSMATQLSAALGRLAQSWDVKKQQMERIITEREILVDTLPDILIMVNDDKKIVRTNRAARAIFGQNLANRDLLDVIPNRMLVDAVGSVVEDLRGREVEFRIEEPVLRDFLAVIERFPIPSAGGMSIVITMNDITELKSVEQMRADFVANASHEIRTPLTTISGLIETLQGPAKEDAQARDDFLALMAQQAERMRQLISDLLSLSKIEMNEHSIPMDEVDIGQIIRDSSQHFEHPAKEKGMSLILDLQKGMPSVQGDARELAMVVHNLIGNAIKYGNKDSDVVISARVTSELPRDQNMRTLSRVMMVSVKDQGEGIAKEHLARLTERFYRVDTARTRQIGGTGLGLAIVKGILNRHRGAITIDSIQGKGSTFSIFLPLYEEF
jgi:two-component system phosphate regulon sensor histidine kinase PhoR